MDAELPCPTTESKPPLGHADAGIPSHEVLDIECRDAYRMLAAVRRSDGLEDNGERTDTGDLPAGRGRKIRIVDPRGMVGEEVQLIDIAAVS